MKRESRLWLVLAGTALLQTRCATIFSSQHDARDYTPLFAEASAGDVVLVRHAIESDRGALQAREWDNATLLHVAVQQHHLELARLLVASGAEVDAVTADALTPLHMAATNGNISMMRLLLSHGAAINALDNKDWTPLDRAEKWNHPMSAAFLQNNGGKESRNLH